jgi:hypothetical protein
METNKITENWIRQKKLEPETPASMDSRILMDAYRSMPSEQVSPGHSGHGRIIMKTTVKFAAAAIVLITALTLIYHFSGSIDGANIALADVAKNIEQIQYWVFQKTTTITAKDNSIHSFNSLVYYTQAAVREDTYINDKIVKQAYVNPSEGTFVEIDHILKVFDKKPLSIEDINQMSQIGPNNWVSQILSKGECTKLERKMINGVPSEGFEFNDKRGMLSINKTKFEKVTTRLWVDINTNLPIQIEFEGVYTGNLIINAVLSDPKWDIKLDMDFFEPKIPADYIESKQRRLIGINLENWPVLKVIPGMAAAKAGIKDGDIIQIINGESISHINTPTDAQTFFFNHLEEKMVITIKRGEQTYTFEIEREALPK